MRTLTALLFSLMLAPAWAMDIQSDNLFPRVKMETSLGTLIVELDRTRAPLSVDNFLRYVVKGAYDNTSFHRVVAEFVVQGGGYTASGDPIDEGETLFNESGNGLSNQYGTIAMAREKAPHTATNQFYFNLADNSRLDPSRRRWGYAVFGMVTEGLEVLDAMGQVPVEYDPDMGADSKPVKPLLLIKATLMLEQ
ncbi:peptidyl-prolyl cis-trans isomerase [Ferrimonas sediminicola]|uniref:Peptidyl-prolyl cis-trans isomerase n=1 Tax=Ferrimonas sediminicola TaxID=2569538 RepID=A0A4U1BEN7_9GAMM|nr:peptidylprolyl isomerase [Ferrimonas sediminicola]TKB49694.1 peptidyl-prolyl cis-trans isomerase [Ferrimonas sediminicola]